MDDAVGQLIFYLIAIVVVIAIVVAVIGTILSIGIFILGAIAIVGMIGGLIKGTMNFFEVLKEAHDKLP